MQVRLLQGALLCLGAGGMCAATQKVAGVLLKNNVTSTSMA